jgi:signal transduction histidine kinase
MTRFVRIRDREGLPILVGGATLVLALLTVFAIELSGALSQSRDDIERTFRQRASLASALTSSIFASTAGQSRVQNTRRYGGERVPQQALDRTAGQSQAVFLAVLSANGEIVAASSAMPPAARARLVSGSPTVAAVRAGRPIALSDILATGPGGTRLIEYAQSFPTKFGTRILVTGFRPQLISAFLGTYLREASNVPSGVAYVLDRRGQVVGATDRRAKVGALTADRGLSESAVTQAQGSYGDGRWFASAPVEGSPWSVVLTASKSRLFASVSGASKWVPWLVFSAFAAMALAALALGRRLLRASADIARANLRLAATNDELAGTNRRLERRAAELSRSNAELEQFASIASHDLQEPLRKVRTFTEQLTTMEADQLSERGVDYLARTSNAAERMQNLIDDLLKFSRVATHGRPFAPVSLAEVAAGVAGDLETSIAEAGAIVHLGELPTINADAFQIRQLLQNLLSNAVKFRRDDVAPEVWIDAVVDGDLVHLSVRDNGIGFDDQYRTRIFNIFERLHGRGAYPGTGIGLALVRKIAERHNGTVTAQGSQGEGARFTVTLPVNQREEVISTESYARDDQGSEAVHAVA